MNRRALQWFRCLVDGAYRQQVRQERERKMRFVRILQANNSIMLDYRRKDD
jgi:hypothetical protein